MKLGIEHLGSCRWPSFQRDLWNRGAPTLNQNHSYLYGAFVGHIQLQDVEAFAVPAFQFLKGGSPTRIAASCNHLLLFSLLQELPDLHSEGFKRIETCVFMEKKIIGMHRIVYFYNKSRQKEHQGVCLLGSIRWNSQWQLKMNWDSHGW